MTDVGQMLRVNVLVRVLVEFIAVRIDATCNREKLSDGGISPAVGFTGCVGDLAVLADNHDTAVGRSRRAHSSQDKPRTRAHACGTGQVRACSHLCDRL